MNWTLEVIVVPVSNVDQARNFYETQLGFNVDHDTEVNESMRIVQLTPPGSGCSIVIGTGIPMSDGAIKGLQLVVNDIHKAHAQLVANGVEVSEITRMGENRPDFSSFSNWRFRAPYFPRPPTGTLFAVCPDMITFQLRS